MAGLMQLNKIKEILSTTRGSIEIKNEPPLGQNDLDCDLKSGPDSNVPGSISVAQCAPEMLPGTSLADAVSA